MDKPVPFTIDIPRRTIDAILAKVRAYDWHEMPQVAPGGDRWAYGTDMTYLREFCAYWIDGFDWAKAQATLNRFPQFKANVDGQEVHFIHLTGAGKNRTALLLTHGWPGSVYEFFDVITLLAHPQESGGGAVDGVDVIVPALPGYGFSGKPPKPVGPRHTATLWDKLMRDVLGYDDYIAQGGDWGAVVSGWLGCRHGVDRGGGCKAVHLNMYGVRPAAAPATEAERAWADRASKVFRREGAYLQMQVTKPQTLSYAMMDSPVGIAAWILEKFHAWSDRRGPDGREHIENAFSKERLLTNIMIYLVTRSFNTSTWFYRGNFEEGGTTMPAATRVEVPTAVANFPNEFIPFPPRSLMDKGYNVVRWTDFARGGHFAAMETGQVFADDVRAFIKQVDTARP